MTVAKPGYVPGMDFIDQARALLGHRVQVWPAFDRAKTGRPIMEGKVLGVSPAPTILVRDDHGRQEDWQITLPITDLGPQPTTPEVTSSVEVEDALVRLLTVWGMTPGQEKVEIMRVAFEEARELLLKRGVLYAQPTPLALVPEPSVCPPHDPDGRRCRRCGATLTTF